MSEVIRINDELVIIDGVKYEMKELESESEKIARENFNKIEELQKNLQKVYIITQFLPDSEDTIVMYVTESEEDASYFFELCQKAKEHFKLIEEEDSEFELYCCNALKK
jgi:hypothetical protein